jgi:hypothetical protein
MSAALVIARCSARQAKEPGGSSTTPGLVADGVPVSGLGDAAGLDERVHAALVTSTVNPNKAAQNDRCMGSA